MIKINIHPNPSNNNHDHCLPYAAGPRKTEAADIKSKLMGKGINKRKRKRKMIKTLNKKLKRDIFD